MQDFLNNGHKKIHKNLEYDEDSKCFRIVNGKLLDTIEKHELYIQSIGVEYEHKELK